MQFPSFRRSHNPVPSHQAAHLTWAKSTAGRTFQRTSVFLKRQLWIWPILAAVLLSTLGFFVRRAIEATMRDGLRSQIQSVVDLETDMLASWNRVKRSNAESLANNLDIRASIYPLLDSATAADVDTLRTKLAKSLGPALTAYRYAGYVVTDKNLRIVASSSTPLIGQVASPQFGPLLSVVLDGQSHVSAPFPSIIALTERDGQTRTGVPTILVAAPIRDESFQVVGALALRIDPTEDFCRILSLGRFGASGETYAIDGNGRMVSQSRYDDELVLLGLLPDEDTSSSILKLLVRDPGGDMTRGFRPQLRRAKLPHTFAAGEAIAQRDGVNVEGYRDYRGVLVVGGWRWLPNGDIGVVTEIDYAEAYRPLSILKWTFWALFALLALSSIAIFVFTLMVARLQKQAREAAIEAKQLGQYKLLEKLGEGAMGVVYRGQHAMLRRPTAIKLLSAERLNDTAIARFEREVQITSNLNHPNTVAIYDYGRTPEGVFYYAMEYLDGIDLQRLVELYGPQPAGRVIYILRQACGSLYEAHTNGLVHRDIKPANIMLNRRGSEGDVVKVLDFGLVKARDEEAELGVAGTPLYMSPEAVSMPASVDACSDVYAVGAVAYFLLTGQPVFEARNFSDLCQLHATEIPKAPSLRLGRPVAADLENVILACLEKGRARRPQTARELSQLLARCEDAARWSLEEADAWWGRHERGQAQNSLSGNPTQPLINPHSQTIDHQ